MARLLSCLFLLLITTALLPDASARPAALRLSPDQKMTLAGRIELLEDPGRSLSLEQVREASGWKLLPGMPNAGFTSSAIWLRLRLEQPADVDPDWRLELEVVQIDELRLYSPTAEGQWIEQRTGRFLPHSRWPIRSRTPAFSLELPPGTHDVYLRLQGTHTLSGDLRIWPPEAFRERNVTEALAFGAFFGIFFVVIVLQLFYTAVVREKASGWYLLYTLALLCGMLLNAGYPQNLLDLTTASTIHLIGVYLCLAPAVVVRLSVLWLELDHHLPRTSRVFQWVVYLLAFLTALMAAYGMYVPGVTLSQALTLLWTLVTFGLGLWIWRRRDPKAGLYLLVFGFIDVGLLTRFARNLGLLPVSFWTDYALFIGTTLHLIAMSLYFIVRFDALRSSLAVEQRAREEQRDFVGMVSHEFRTPLAIISTSIQQLSANLDAPIEKSRARARNVLQAVQRLNLLLDDYLSLDRLDTAQQAIKPRPCDLYELIEEAASDWPVGRVRISIRDLPVQFSCDPDLMRIVLRNLLANADRHSPPDTVIDLDVAGQEGGRVSITVRDRGEGIAADDLPRLFQRYYRGRAAQGKPGAGLGLYLVRRIVTGHGGTIEVQSVQGQGAVFHLMLPVSAVLRS